uniref:AIG1-type G domain-containing protein n=1 Tax=Oreochromis aureus TaxID=47969 RepID=A0A668URU7_OREAU
MSLRNLIKPRETKMGSLTKKTVGTKNPNKANKNILLVGETGAGKSTLINSMVNYTMGVKCHNKLWFQIVEDEKRSQAESQTSDVIVYEIFGFEDETLPYSLTIIDTPGYGDTRGVEKDDIVIQRLFQLFQSEGGVDEVHAVGLVMKAALNRVSDRQKYIFDSVMSLFGKDVEKNIVALITHSDGMPASNVLEALETANIKCAKNVKHQPVHFLFNNCLNTEITEENEFGLDTAWRVTEKGMSQFKVFLENTPPQKLKTTVEVLNSQIRLKACFQNLKERIDFIEVKQKEIVETEKALKDYRKEMEYNERFTVNVPVSYKDKQSIRGGTWGLGFYEGAVCCKVCEENCHYPDCTIAWYPKDCQVMNRGHCTSCTRKCPASDHVKEEWIYVPKIKYVTKTDDEMKKKYEMNKTEGQNKQTLFEHLAEEMKKLTAEKSQLLDESYQHLVRLEQIALKTDTIQLDDLIKKMTEKGDIEKVRKLTEMKKRVAEANKSGKQNIFIKLSFRSVYLLLSG